MSRAFSALFCLFASAGFAQSNSISISSPPEGQSQESLKKALGNPKYAPDPGITDLKLKAEAGSLSKYSMKFSMIYLGPDIGNLGAKDRPNPDHLVGSFATTLSGAMSFRNRLSSQSAMNFGTGVNALYPLHGFQRFDLRTPFMSYDFMHKIGDFQLRHSLGASKTSVPEYLNVGQVAGASYDFSFVRDLGTSRFAVGLDAGLSYSFYNREYIAPSIINGKRKYNDGNAQNYTLILSPNMKYNFSDHLVATTSLSLLSQNLRRSESWSSLKSMTPTQRLGVSYSFSRDFLTGAFLNYYPSRVAMDQATIGVLGIFSML